MVVSDPVLSAENTSQWCQCRKLQNMTLGECQITPDLLLSVHTLTEYTALKHLGHVFGWDLRGCVFCIVLFINGKL